MSTTIKDQLSAVIAARKNSIIALRGRIADLLSDVPVGTILSDSEGEVCRVIRVCTGASQWSNRTWDVTIKGRAYLAPSGKMLAEDIDGSYWDDHNMHTRSTEPTMGYAHGEANDTVYGFASGADTRVAAVRLAGAIERYMATCAAEVEANEATAVAEVK
jgi:hypothetical protein